MNSLRQRLLLLLLSLSCLAHAHPLEDSTSKDSVLGPAEKIHELVVYDRYYPFINYGDNYIEWADYSAVERFFWALGQTDRRKMTVVHIGDSHVQADWITGHVRESFQQHFGLGGRGSVFPFACAKTHSSYDYVTYKYGQWFHSRNVMREPAYNLGMSGSTVATADTTASFRFVFVDGYLRPSSTQLRIFCDRDTSSFDLVLQIGKNDTLHIDVFPENFKKQDTLASDTQMLVVDLPRVSDTLHFYIKKNRPSQSRLELYGISLEKPEDKGVLYHSVGVNGAGYKAIMRQNLLYDQLSMVGPDLVVIDFGANDFKRRYYNKKSLKEDLGSIIDSVQKTLPNASILVTNVQDAYQGRWNLVECEWFAVHTRQVALRKGCAYYDYYHVSGERYSMLQWRRWGLSKRDRVHLKPAGYRVKGELYFNAMMNSYAAALEKGKPKKLLVKEAKAEKQKQAKFKNQAAKIPAKPEKERHYYQIRYGDNLSIIADRHGVRVSDLMAWNNLQSNKIFPGKTLIIYSQDKAPKPQPKPKTEQKQATPTPSGNKTTYTVREGENLGIIAQKFRVTIPQLKAWNKLPDDRINMGQTLTLYPGKAPSQEKAVEDAQKEGYYTIRSGDSLWKISQEFDLSVDELIMLNNLEGDELKPGQELKVKP